MLRMRSNAGACRGVQSTRASLGRPYTFGKDESVEIVELNDSHGAPVCQRSN